MADQEQELAYRMGSTETELEHENESLRDQLESMGRILEDEKAGAKRLREILEGVQKKLERTEAEASELKRKNNQAFSEKTDAEGELSELQFFCYRAAKEVGLEPGNCTTTDVLKAIKKKTKMSCHEEIGGSTLVKAKRILDPNNQHETLIQAAKAVMDGRAGGLVCTERRLRQRRISNPEIDPQKEEEAEDHASHEQFPTPVAPPVTPRFDLPKLETPFEEEDLEEQAAEGEQDEGTNLALRKIAMRALAEQNTRLIHDMEKLSRSIRVSADLSEVLQRGILGGGS